MKPIAISEVYTQGSAMAKYKFKPKVGSIISETARGAPPAISKQSEIVGNILIIRKEHTIIY